MDADLARVKDTHGNLSLAKFRVVSKQCIAVPGEHSGGFKNNRCRFSLHFVSCFPLFCPLSSAFSFSDVDTYDSMLINFRACFPSLTK